MGFEQITIIDGDVVEKNNLNRQNYTYHDIGKPKVSALCERLKSINPNASIKTHYQYLTTENIDELVQDCDVVINAIDFTSDAPFVLDQVCVAKNIPALHPYNLGWMSCVFVVDRESRNLFDISTDYHGFELKFADFVINRLIQQNQNMQWFTDVIRKYKKEDFSMPPPQLSVASWQVAGICTDILFCLATQRKIKLFPDFYIETIHNERQTKELNHAGSAHQHGTLRKTPHLERAEVQFYSDI
jgi:hypothetical protein